MWFKINKKVFEKFPDLVVAIPIIYGFDNNKAKQESESILRETEEILKNNLDMAKLMTSVKVRSYIDCFTKFGIDPNVFLPAHVALSKRVLEGGNIPSINPMVNLYNSFSIANTTPFGGEDLDKVYGNFRLFVAEGGEKWYPIGGKKSKPAVAGELVWGDDLDLSTRALNWRQCDRTKLTADSKNGYFVMDGFKGINDDLIRRTAEIFVETATGLFGGNGQILWLDADHSEAEIDFVSKNIKDIVEVKKEPVRPTTAGRQAQGKIKQYHFLAKNIYDVAQTSVEHPAIEKFGDFAVRGDFDFSNLPIVEKIDKVAGFSNVWIKPEVLVQEAKNILGDEFKKELAEINKGKKILLEHTSPEPTKTLHIGHFRNNFLGMAMHNILEILGVEVTLDCIDNDRGMKICKTIWGYLVFGNKKVIEKIGIENYIEKFKTYKITDEEIVQIYEVTNWKFLLDKWVENPNDWYKPNDFDLASDKFDNVLYSPASRAADLKVEINDQVQDVLLAWESGEKNVRLVWRQIIDWSTEGYKKTYQRIGSIHDKVWHESDHYKLGKEWVDKGLKVGVFKKLEDGAILTNLEKYDLPDTIVIKRDGTSNYLTQDLQLTYQKVNTYPSDLYIWDIGNDQLLYLQQMFAVCEQLGIVSREKLFHLNYGFITLAGAKMSSRFGGVINGDDLLDELKAKMKEIILTSGSEGKDIDIEHASEVLALGACKYGFLKVDKSKTIVYDIEKSVSVQGDSGPYLQYTYARCKSVIGKSKLQTFPQGDFLTGANFKIDEKFDENEMPLLRYFYIFSEKIVEAGERFSPAVLAEYLLNLARKYNEFYGKCRIVGEPEEGRRIFLTQVTAKILKDGLELLGIETLEKM